MIANEAHLASARSQENTARLPTNRFSLLLRKCEKAMMLAKREADLLNSVCRILVEDGGWQAALVGLSEDEGNTLRLGACAGDVDDFSKTGIMHASGPTMIAIGTRKIKIFRDISSNCSLGNKQGTTCLTTIASLPLIFESRCLGALTAFFPNADSFTGEAVEFLNTLTGDIAYAIATSCIRTKPKLQRESLLSECAKQNVARKLHEGLCQHLTGTAIMSKLLQRRLALKEDPDAAYAMEISNLLDDAVADALKLSRLLHPSGS